MRYIQDILNEGEEVVAEIRFHWWVWVRAVLAFISRLAILTVAGVYALDFIAGMDGSSKELYRKIVFWALIAGGAYALVKLAIRIIQFLTTERAVTARRLVFKEGLIARSTAELSLARIEEINLDQSVLGRILGFGTLSISGTGGDDRLVMAEIADPIAVRRSIDDRPEPDRTTGE
jgi:uncharacterized membrane protein YdbT with pleckstrin-like domain